MSSVYSASPVHWNIYHIAIKYELINGIQSKLVHINGQFRLKLGSVQKPAHEVITLSSCSTQLSMKFQLLTIAKILKS